MLELKKIDWAPFEKILSKVYNKPVGRKSYPALMMFKCLLLQNWYNPSDFRAWKICFCVCVTT